MLIKIPDLLDFLTMLKAKITNENDCSNQKLIFINIQGESEFRVGKAFIYRDKK